MPETTTNQRTIRIKDLAVKLQVSPPTIWKYVREMPGFPQPYKLSEKVTVWDGAEVELWLTNRRISANKGSGSATKRRPA